METASETVAARRAGITHRDLARADQNVRRALEDLGLLTMRLQSTRVRLDTLDSRACFARYEAAANSIWVPAVCLATILAQLQGASAETPSLHEILSHEYGHAFAYHHPELLLSRGEFMSSFGQSCYLRSHSKAQVSRQEHITALAASGPGEDFAECFRCYVVSRGHVQRFQSRPLVYQKLCLIDQIALTLKAGKKVAGIVKQDVDPAGKAKG